MPLFMVKKEVFEWIRTGHETFELRRERKRINFNADSALPAPAWNLFKLLVFFDEL
jgi:hypothetical protein